MKAQNLIELLSRLDPNTNVLIGNFDEHGNEVELEYGVTHWRRKGEEKWNRI